ncbi:MAG: hypothetical protein RBS49_09495 [Sphaerochaeta sp.]|jgi:hypothetical protein|nr:hypothetical protein [Sphaerochaeta sp.]MDY0187793.1 hypothetical protein [Syntrophus sp. (in: bacteria)]
MAVKFAIYSIDIAATLDPWDADPAPATMIDLGEDPIFGDYDPNAGSKGRGARIATLGGAVDQDFGSFVQDGRIRLAVQNVPIAAATIATLDAAFAAIDTQYFFTDSVNCWTVKFVKPDGFRALQNLFFKSASNDDVFSYEILLKIDAKNI